MVSPNKKEKNAARKVLLVVLDGVGWSKKIAKEEAQQQGNAVQYAETPNLDFLMNQDLSCVLDASGEAVGLRPGEAGNSEVGHLTIGSGQRISQGGAFVDHAISEKIPFQSETWKKMLTEDVRSGKSKLHFLTLLSDGNVHAHQKHLHRFLEEAVTAGVPSIRIHLLFDGRDVPFGTAEQYLFDLKDHIATLSLIAPDIKIASGGGREVITMDRYERNWDQVKRGYDTHVLGEGIGFETPEEALRRMRVRGIHNDQLLEPFVIVEDGKPVGVVQDGDSFVFLNFRGDRAVQFCESLEPHFSKFTRSRVPKIQFAGLLQYDPDQHRPQDFLIPYQKPQTGLAAFLSDHKIKQWACSEIHKFGHVTYFFNGLHSKPFPGQIYAKVPSQDAVVEHPAMSAPAITQATIEALKGDAKFLVVNYPNADMMGHTGNWDATVKAVEVLDAQLELLIKHASSNDVCLIVVGDHGNADLMFHQTDLGKVPHVSHTCSSVPFCIWNPPDMDFDFTPERNSGLSRLAATVAQLMGLKPLDHWDTSLLDH